MAWALALIVVSTVAIREIAVRRYGNCVNRDEVVSTINGFMIGAGLLAVAIVFLVNGVNVAAAAFAVGGIGFVGWGVRLLRRQRSSSFQSD